MKQLFLFATILIALTPLVSCTPGQRVMTLNCVPLTIQRSDPIVNPGVPGGHVHAIIGGNAFQRTMEGTDATKADQTTCNKLMDKSNYWVPQLYHIRADGMFEMVEYRGSAVYYELRACDYSPTAKSCDYSGTNFSVPKAFPDGFRMVAGDPFRRTQNNSDPAQRAPHVSCIDNGGNWYGFPKVHCDTMRWEVYFPSCWDGVNVDSPDHKSHVAYPAIGDFNFGVCPKSHPVAIFSLFFEFFFTTGVYNDIGKFAFANGDPTGYGFHGDFIMGWTNRTLLQTAHHDCKGVADCPLLGNQGQDPRPLIHPAIYEEDIGLKNPIPKLPGNNPLTYGPSNYVNDIYK
jgi:hypothetical protein